MGYYTTITGYLDVAPPVPWSKIRDTRFLPEYFRQDDWRTFVFDVKEETVETDEGTLTRKGAQRIICGSEDGFKAYHAEEHLQALVDHLGPGYSYEGMFEGFGEENGDMWRLVVRNGTVVKIEPTITWPTS
jgi:hypothetical protein